jgi:hypothetical protein
VPIVLLVGPPTERNQSGSLDGVPEGKKLVHQKTGDIPIVKVI